MSENGTPDLSKIIGLIMENPRLIEEISNLAAESEKRDMAEESDASIATDTPTKETSAEVTYTKQGTNDRARRAHLLGALKPYLSNERAKAIDSMISIADILDMMKAR